MASSRANLMMQLQRGKGATVSASHLNRFAKESSIRLPVVIRENTSSSYPTINHEVTDEDVRSYKKDRQKKDKHKEVERRRRYNINDRIKELGQMVPKSLDPDMRWNKGSILKAAVDYIHSLHNDQSRSRQARSETELRAKHMETTNRQLQMRVQQLEAILQYHGISFPPLDSMSERSGMDTMPSYPPPSASTNQSLFTDFDMPGFEYTNPGTAAMSEGPYSALLTDNDTTNFNDIMMIKDDLFFSETSIWQ